MGPELSMQFQGHITFENILSHERERRYNIDKKYQESYISNIQFRLTVALLCADFVLYSHLYAIYRNPILLYYF